MAPLRPTKPLSRPSTTPRSSGKFLTAVTSAPVLANDCELAPTPDGDKLSVLSVCWSYPSDVLTALE
ncbi:hypothetical protein PVAP13_9NG158273 [Panicum virgatum]|uniref:Uncharacterized protein n=1 Tax=Panicum virgatum TaxID=38727 RepID=A0A8T0MFL4_PANVG|nr:hypothetical protein PVAP13_9NG158273 [Panicum virgatum]